MVFDKGCLFEDLRPGLLLYLHNIASLGGAKLATPYRACLEQIKDDLQFMQELHNVNLSDIAAMKVNAYLKMKGELVE